jgi:hypothetical protein
VQYPLGSTRSTSQPLTLRVDAAAPRTRAGLRDPRPDVVGTVVVIAAALTARSVALAGFRLDSPIGIGASAIVIWQLKDTATNARAAQFVRSALPAPRYHSRTNDSNLAGSVSAK